MIELKNDISLLQMVVDNSSASIMITDQNAKIVYVNQRTCDLTGFSESELVGNNPSILSSGTQPGSFYEEMWSTLKSGEVWDGTFLNKTKSGQLYKERAQIIPVPGDTQAIDYYIAIKDDITALHKKGEDLEEMISILEELPNEIYIVDPDSMNYRYMNSIARDHLMVDSSEVSSYSVRDIHDDEYEGTMKTIYAQLYSGALKQEILSHYHRPTEGDKYPVNETMQLITYKNAEALLVSVTDATQLQDAETELTKSNRYLSEYFEITSEILLQLDQDGTINRINSSGSELLEYQKDELIGKNWIDLCIPEYLRDQVTAAFDQVVTKSSGLTHTFQNFIKTKSGKLRIINWRNTNLIDIKTGETIVLSAGQDITESREAELQRSLLSELVEQSDDIISLISKDLNYEFVNSAYAAVFDREKTDIIGKSVKEVHGLQLYDSVKPKLIACREGNVVAFSEWVNLPNKGKRLLHVKYTPLYDDKNEVRGIISASRDETEQKILEDKRIELTRQLQKSQRLEVIGRMAAGIAHDFNNILQVQSLNLGIVRNAITEDHDLYDNFNQVERARERATDLVRQILTFSRSSKSEIQSTRAQSIVNEVLKMVSSTCPSDVSIKRRINKEVKRIKCDPKFVDQIVMNLCNNAIFAMKDISDREKIMSVSYDYPRGDSHVKDKPPGFESEFVELKICDTGVGMDRKIENLVFDPFFTTKSVGEGSGLGLSIVHGMMTELGGKISIDSKKNQGTCFRLWFPVADKKSTQTVMDPQGAKVSDPLKILFIDDEEMIRIAAKTTLTKWGHAVETFHTAEEGLSFIVENQSQIDLIISDLSMPGMSGIELVNLLRQELVFIPTIISSGNIELSVEERIKRMPATTFLRKPWNSDQLLEQINKALSDQENDLTKGTTGE